MHSIGIISSQHSLEHIMKIDCELRQRCNVTYLPYTSMEHLKFLYLQNIEQFDAVLFSGSFPYEVILDAFGEIKKPYGFFNVSDRDYYRLIARLAVQQPGLDFSRVYLDQPEIDIDLDSIFNSANHPLMGSPDMDIISNHIEQSYSYMIEYYSKLWESGNIDLIVTRFNSIDKQLSDLNIRHEFLFPSPESMLETFRKLLLSLTSETANDTATAIGLVVPLEDNLTKEQYNDLFTHLQADNKQLGMPFLVHKNGPYFELICNIATLKNLSHQYTACPITAYLQEKLPFDICVGWGCSSNVVDAYRNAHRALKEAKRVNTSASFIITADNMVIGLLSSIRGVSYSDIPNEKLIRLGEHLSLSPLYLSRIKSVLQQKGGDTLSAEELAFYLNITSRSASRILGKLVDGGVAAVQYNHQLNLRGRPARIYQIQLKAFDA